MKEDLSPQLSFEEAMSRIEEISRQLEAGEISLEASLAAFDEGMRLVRQCSRQLEEARQKVTMLIEENGETQEAPFDLHGEEDAGT